MIDTTVKALKNLCATLLADGSVWNDIPGDTVVDVINQITIAKGGEIPSGDELGTLVLTSKPGSTVGTTKITVSGNGSGKLYYKTAGTVSLPAYLEDISEWITWDGTADITAEDGEMLCIAEADSHGHAIAAGTATVNAKTE